MRKGILSKLLSDVENLENLREENTPLLTEGESLNLAEEIAQDIEEYAIQESDANFITSTIAEVEEKKSDIEVGLQSDINPQIASLLLSNLNKSISKLDSSAIIDQAGLQSDNKDRILRDGLLSADNVLSKAWEALKKLWEDIKKKGLSIIAKLRKFFADKSKKIKEKDQETGKAKVEIKQSLRFQENAKDKNTWLSSSLPDIGINVLLCIKYNTFPFISYRNVPFEYDDKSRLSNPLISFIFKFPPAHDPSELNGNS